MVDTASRQAHRYIKTRWVHQVSGGGEGLLGGIGGKRRLSHALVRDENFTASTLGQRSIRSALFAVPTLSSLLPKASSEGIFQQKTPLSVLTSSICERCVLLGREIAANSFYWEVCGAHRRRQTENLLFGAES